MRVAEGYEPDIVYCSICMVQSYGELYITSRSWHARHISGLVTAFTYDGILPSFQKKFHGNRLLPPKDFSLEELTAREAKLCPFLARLGYSTLARVPVHHQKTNNSSLDTNEKIWIFRYFSNQSPGSRKIPSLPQN